jgi:hypothetical protein
LQHDRRLVAVADDDFDFLALVADVAGTEQVAARSAVGADFFDDLAGVVVGSEDVGVEPAFSPRLRAVLSDEVV